ncbi:ATP cone domain-containing protein [uncultured Clostridium sp.]|uniref:ATP cone domain-containing protein n=1 Tax=uncultured Clostridium sp. TaxID=59620 RepID=UPI0025EACDFB|nr:ATP cone domain-containing protein [uncultured Clostridium sp.]
MKIIKKDGRIQEFNKDKIYTSLISSANSLDNVRLNESDIKVLVEDITKAIKELRKDETLTSSYEIIGIVSSVLVRDGFKEVLKAYLEY